VRSQPLRIGGTRIVAFDNDDSLISMTRTFTFIVILNGPILHHIRSVTFFLLHSGCDAFAIWRGTRSTRYVAQQLPDIISQSGEEQLLRQLQQLYVAFVNWFTSYGSLGSDVSGGVFPIGTPSSAALVNIATDA
jgi:hypothetical protein